MATLHPNFKPWQPSKTPTHREAPASTSFSVKSKRIHARRISNEINQTSAGKIKRLVLTPEGRAKLNAYPDREFYALPRFVTHVDYSFISTLTDLYRERLSPGSEILDLMSSWVSHLPKEVEYKRVVGHGLNAQELAKNPMLDYFFVKDLNLDQKLEMESSSLDAVLCTVSVQYLQQPEKVFQEVFRVLRPGGVFIVSFSNRMFYEKAIAAWRDGTGYSRVQLVTQYFQCVEGFTQPEIVRKIPAATGSNQEDESPLGWIMRLLGMISGSDPFYAVIAYKNFKLVHEIMN
ncbi:Sterol 24-C-methyltransferase [Bertholletia excelsa]